MALSLTLGILGSYGMHEIVLFVCKLSIAQVLWIIVLIALIYFAMFFAAVVLAIYLYVLIQLDKSPSSSRKLGLGMF